MTTSKYSRATIAVVTSRSFDYKGPHSKHSAAVPPGKEFANFVERQLVTNGSRTIGKLVPGEGGWTFDIELNGDLYRIFVHWAPIGSPPVDRWIIQPDICKAWFRSLFGCKTAETEIIPLVKELHRVLDRVPEVEEIEWITREEFAEIY